MPKRTGRPPGLKTYGPKIKALRVEHGLTKVQLAARLGLNEESIRRAERGGPLGDVTTSRLAKALGVTMRDISDWDGEDVSEPETPARISA
jgi:transcriptional regulator with XRE-family HTH domain